MFTPARARALLEAFGPATVRDLSIVLDRTPRMARFALERLRAEGVAEPLPGVRPVRWAVRP